MKYIKILIYPSIWHIKPYKIKHVILGGVQTEYGFLCFKLVITLQ